MTPFLRFASKISSLFGTAAIICSSSHSLYANQPKTPEANLIQRCDKLIDKDELRNESILIYFSATDMQLSDHRDHTFHPDSRANVSAWMNIQLINFDAKRNIHDITTKNFGIVGGTSFRATREGYLERFAIGRHTVDNMDSSWQGTLKCADQKWEIDLNFRASGEFELDQPANNGELLSTFHGNIKARFEFGPPPYNTFYSKDISGSIEIIYVDGPTLIRTMSFKTAPFKN